MINIYTNMNNITEYHWLKNRPDYERIIAINAKKKRRKKLKKNNKSLKAYLSYDNQLSHPLWLKKREHILNKKGRKCSKCGSSKNLQVHHLKYVWGRMAWEYKDKDLIVLCDSCHERIHCIDLDKEFKAITT